MDGRLGLRGIAIQKIQITDTQDVLVPRPHCPTQTIASTRAIQNLPVGMPLTLPILDCQKPNTFALQTQGPAVQVVLIWMPYPS